MSNLLPEELQEATRDAVASQFKPGGKPVEVYLRVNAKAILTEKQGIDLTNEIMRSFEDRLCALESKPA